MPRMPRALRVIECGAGVIPSLRRTYSDARRGCKVRVNGAGKWGRDAEPVITATPRTMGKAMVNTMWQPAQFPRLTPA